MADGRDLCMTWFHSYSSKPLEQYLSLLLLASASNFFNHAADLSGQMPYIVVFQTWKVAI